MRRRAAGGIVAGLAFANADGAWRYVVPRFCHTPVAMKMSQCFAVECQVPYEGTARVNVTVAEYTSLLVSIHVFSPSTHASVCNRRAHRMMGRLVVAVTSTDRW